MSPFYSDDSVTLWQGDALDVVSQLPDGSVDCVVTSPPYYGLRDYGVEGQYGLEESPAAYVETMRALFGEVRRVLVDEGTLWLNIGDSYSRGEGTFTDGPQQSRNGKGVVGPRDLHPSARRAAGTRSFTSVPSAKNLLGIPWRLAFALQDDGWILRNDIIWAKPNAMPESVTDRLSTKHEHLFMFAKRAKYWFDLDRIREPLLEPERHGHVFGGNSTDVGRRRGNTYTPKTRGQGQWASVGNQQDPGPNGLGANLAGRNPGDVWSIPTQPYPGAHFAVMPQTLASRCIQAGCKPGGTVLDPFSGSGTTGLAAAKHGRKYVGIDLNREYLELSLRTRLAQTALLDIEEPA